MFIIYLLGWWYGSGWLRQWQLITSRLTSISRNFSVIILLRTLFSPWKQLISHSGNNAFSMQKFTDNMISRFVGFFIRSLTLMAASLSLLVTAVLSIVAAIIWPALPPLSILALLKGLGIL